MIYYTVILLICMIWHQSTLISAGANDDDDYESLWSTSTGNSQNTYRLIPSMPTNYSKLSWIYEYNITSQDVTQFGQAAGINGDIYFFLSETRTHPADFMLCLTPNGNVRWKLYVDPVPDMEPIGVSNIVIDLEGTLYYTISWSGDTIYTAKICRITHAQTSHPIQQCIENNQLFMYINSPLSINEKYNLLITAVSDNEIESIPAVLNKTTLKLLWINRHFFGAGMNGHYRYDIKNGDLFWIGGDDHLLKFDYNGENLINNNTQLDGFGRDFVLDRQQEIIVRPWQNMTSIDWKLVVSSHDVSTRKIQLRWNWYLPALIADNDDITSPTINENGTVYLSSMPLAFAIDNSGKTLWTSELATTTEMKTFGLVSLCITMNFHRRILYILSGSANFQKSKYFYFITAVNMTNGQIIKRIDLNLGHEHQITPYCPILIGDQLLYFVWLTGKYPKLVPFKLTAIEQL